jgi:hypothetical protein
MAHYAIIRMQLYGCLVTPDKFPELLKGLYKCIQIPELYMHADSFSTHFSVFQDSSLYIISTHNNTGF